MLIARLPLSDDWNIQEKVAKRICVVVFNRSLNDWHHDEVSIPTSSLDSKGQPFGLDSDWIQQSHPTYQAVAGTRNFQSSLKHCNCSNESWWVYACSQTFGVWSRISADRIKALTFLACMMGCFWEKGVVRIKIWEGHLVKVSSGIWYGRRGIVCPAYE